MSLERKVPHSGDWLVVLVGFEQWSGWRGKMGGGGLGGRRRGEYRGMGKGPLAATVENQGKVLGYGRGETERTYSSTRTGACLKGS